MLSLVGGGGWHLKARAILALSASLHALARLMPTEAGSQVASPRYY